MGLFKRKEKEAEKPATIITSRGNVATYQAYCFLHNDEERIAVMGSNHDFELATKTLFIKGYGGKRVYKYPYRLDNVTLEREPKNKADKNAVKILVNGLFFGYVNRNDAPDIGKALKKGLIEKCAVIMKGGAFRKILSEDQSTAGWQDEEITLEVVYR